MTNKERIERLEKCIKKQEDEKQRIIDGWKVFKEKEVMPCVG